MWPTMVALVNLEDLQRISKRYKKTAAGTLIKIDCEDEEDDDYWSSQSARRGRHDSSDDEQAKFEKEQHDRAVGLQMQQEILDDCGEGNCNWE